jgi:tetratricopeptide (TPR) repeat protein
MASTAAAAGRQREAEQRYRDLATELPEDAEVNGRLGVLLLMTERPGDAAPFLDRAMALAPSDLATGDYLLRAFGFLGRTEELLAITRRGEQLAPGAQTVLLEAEALLWAGDMEGASRAAAKAAALGELQAVRTLAVAELRAGRGSKALATLATLGARDGAGLAAVELFRGRPRSARKLLDASPPRKDGWGGLRAQEQVLLRAALGPPLALQREVERLATVEGPVVGPVAAVVAWAGEPALAARLAGRLDADSLDEALYRAVAAWRGGRPADALPALRALASGHASGSSFLDGFFLGEAALEAGQFEEAAAALRRHERRNVSICWLAFGHPRSLLLLARALEGQHRLDEARSVAERLGRLWRDAEPDYPGLLELRALEARLRR